MYIPIFFSHNLSRIKYLPMKDGSSPGCCPEFKFLVPFSKLLSIPLYLDWAAELTPEVENLTRSINSLLA